MKRFIKSLAISLLFMQQLFAQPLFQMEHYSVDDGLAQSVVMEIIQDYKGYLWFASWAGLNKFDGYTFKTFKAQPGDGTTFTSNRIDIIHEGLEGNIWCRTYDYKIFLFDSRTETFTDVLYNLESELIQKAIIQTIYPLTKGVVWLTGKSGACFRVDERLFREGKGPEFYGILNNRLKGDVVYNVVQDSDGDEWVFTDKGTTIVGKKVINSDFPFAYLSEEDGQIWLASNNGRLARYEQATGNVSFINMPYNLNIIYTVENIRDKTLAIGSDRGLILFDTENETFKQIEVPRSEPGINHITSIYKDRIGDLWMSTGYKGAIRVDVEKNELQYLYTSEKEMVISERPNRFMIYEDENDYLWIVPKDGNLAYYDRETKKLVNIYTDPKDPETRVAPYVRGYFADKQGNLWLKTYRGLEKVSFFKKSYKINNIDPGYEIRAFLIDDNKNTWIASKSGRIQIFTAEQKFLGYLSANGTLTSNPDHALNASTYCIMEDKLGNIWLGTKTKGLYYLEKKAGNEFSFHVEHYMHDRSDIYSINDNNIYSIFQDSKGNIWLGSYGGGIILVNMNDNGKLTFNHYGNVLKNFPYADCSKVRFVTEVSGNVLMAGSTDGLITFSMDFKHPEEIKFYRNVRHPNKASSLSNNDVLHIFEDSKKNIFVSTISAGINKIYSENLLSDSIHFKAYAKREGLPSDLSLSIIEDPRGYLWVVSENGLSKFYPEKEIFDNYGRYFFKRSITFSESIPVIDAKGKFLFGLDNGMMEIDADKISKSSYVPPIVFTDLKIHNNVFNLDIDNLKEVALKPSQRNITIHFAALDFIDSQEINYAYMLEGLDTQWAYIENNRSASYINIPKGKYRFLVKSTNSDGVWVDNVRTLQLNMIPTFWETIWAWIFYLILIVLLVGIIVYVLLYIYKLRHQVDVEQRLSNIKLRFFTDISHELRTPLTLIGSPVTEVLENEPLSEEARENLILVQKNTNRMLNLVNQILDFRKIQNKKMKLLVEETNVLDYLSRIMESFRLIAEEKKISFELSSAEDNPVLWIDKDKFEKIFFNLISNAFKYTLSGKSIMIRIETDKDNMYISVLDEGVGINSNKQKNLFQRFETLVNNNVLQPSSGIGLSLVKELVELHHGNIEVTSEPNVGSEFKVCFKKGQEHFKDDAQAEFILSDANGTEITETDLSEDENTEESDSDKLSILIVEDNIELRSFLRKILSRDYIVNEAEDGKEGLNKAMKLVPDIIISDVMMPVMDGLDMVKAIKENNDICHIPIILLSAKSSLDDRIKGLEYGIDDYITKPFSATYLKTRVKALLKQRQELQKMFLETLSQQGKNVDMIGFSPSQPKITPYDEVFMQQVMDYMERNMDSTELTIDDFANAMALSRTIFYRKLKSVTGLSPVDFIKEIRIKRAVQLMDSNEYNISQVAYMTGYSDPKYFSKCFKKQTGYNPKEYKEKIVSKAVNNKSCSV